eukprot:CAMPEP_0173463090 /NCGR_PEP_ID=MMETSP1357-20121228/67782_1 /TAXON_ID=77926 /ORGANISM="Hemiselmis rufescens, Strain PCC563" /LENGTH=46 /DNA_ID= /DNA_START= /DNA_END= /DNA_ORIENTATION=
MRRYNIAQHVPNSPSLPFSVATMVNSRSSQGAGDMDAVCGVMKSVT